MCQRSEVKCPQAGRIEFGPEARQEIDFRIVQKLAEREYFQRQYQRGIWDCLYAVIVLAVFAYSVYLLFWKEE